MMVLYSALLYALVPFIVLRLFYRSIKNPAYRQRIAERFGYYKNVPRAGGIWVHAVSVGEAITAIKLIKALQERYPQVAMTVTCGTPTGSQIIQQQLGSRVFHVYAPYDLPGPVKRFLSKVRPSLGIIMETEIWPNLLETAAQADIKLVISNMRLSETSYRQYKKFPRLISRSLKYVDFIAAQTNKDATRAISLGADDKRVKIVGNLKFDLEASVQFSAESIRGFRERLAPQRTIWVAGSTHEGEDPVVLDAHARLLEQDKSLLLILVPRHPERFDDVYRLSYPRFITQRRSELKEGESLADNIQVMLVDSIGELSRFISISDWAFIGGSLVPVGGHNILEACQAGVPVIFGQYMFNFEQIATMAVRKEVGIQLADKAELMISCQQLCSDTSRRYQMGINGRQWIESNQGSLITTLEIIDNVWA
jgi:3-deoxy-D-manno-octulosonic-acid transferase